MFKNGVRDVCEWNVECSASVGYCLSFVDVGFCAEAWCQHPKPQRSSLDPTYLWSIMSHLNKRHGWLCSSHMESIGSNSKATLADISRDMHIKIERKGKWSFQMTISPKALRFQEFIFQRSIFISFFLSDASLLLWDMSCFSICSGLLKVIFLKEWCLKAL